MLIFGLEEDGNAQWVDLSTATPEQLDMVPGARNLQDALDETDRNAARMSSKDFRIDSDLEKSGILNAVYDQLLEGFNDPNKGCFYKPRKDTSGGKNTFGSLVVVFPTFHVGGALHLRHDSTEETFNSSRMLSPFNTPKVAYVAFYGDVEHELAQAVVESGHRVTLMYTLYSTQGSPQRPPSKLTSPTGRDIKTALSGLLDDPEFLPEGGILGFGLRYRYLVDDSTRLNTMKSMLKADALLVRVCEQLGLDTSLQTVYSDEDGTMMVDKIAPLQGEQIEGSVIRALEESYGATLIASDRDPDDPDTEFEVTEVEWITPLSNLTRVESI
ncbi:hypothetical protein C8R43DRAFT_946296 [Mycena crocata]|nr:hypothetical protein C8R43DRAFT_946296 [Mycena crocata]